MSRCSAGGFHLKSSITTLTCIWHLHKNILREIKVSSKDQWRVSHLLFPFVRLSHCLLSDDDGCEDSPLLLPDLPNSQATSQQQKFLCDISTGPPVSIIHRSHPKHLLTWYFMVNVSLKIFRLPICQLRFAETNLQMRYFYSMACRCRFLPNPSFSDCDHYCDPQRGILSADASKPRWVGSRMWVLNISHSAFPFITLSKSYHTSWERLWKVNVAW